MGDIGLRQMIVRGEHLGVLLATCRDEAVNHVEAADSRALYCI